MPPREGPHYRFRDMEFWAEDGLITIVDVRRAEDSDVPHEDSVRHIRPGEMVKRAVAVRMFIGDKYPNRAAEARRLLTDAATAAKLAQRQGIPLTPEAAEEARKRRRKGRIVVPGMPEPRVEFQPGDPLDVMLNGVTEKEVPRGLIT